MNISFIIITNGNKPDKVELQIKSILRQNMSQYEIVVCGDILNLNLLEKFPDANLKLVPDEKNARRGSLGGLRNNACNNTIYENLVISDDDLLFPDNWYSQVLLTSPNYDIMTTCVKNPDGTRFWDNACYMSPTKGHINLNYNEEDDYKYMSGGTGWLIKKSICEKVRWDDKILVYSMRSLNDYSKGLHNDDTDFAERCREAKYKITHNPEITVYHNDDSYTSVGRMIRKRSFMPNFKWVQDINLPEMFLINFGTQMLQSQLIEGLDILRKLAHDGSANAFHLINNYENSLGGPLENSRFSFHNNEYENIIKNLT